MNFIGNRSFVLLKPKMPFVNWVNSYDDNPVSEEEILSNRTLYMVNDVDDDSPSSILKHVKHDFRRIINIGHVKLDNKL